MIRLQLLGTVQLSTEDPQTAPPVVGQPKPLALLAYLAAAAPTGFRRRDELLGLLWPELDATRGRRALSQALFVVRAALGADVILSRGTEEVGIDWQVFWCDVVAFRASADAHRLDDAIAQYRGDFLPGFFLSDAPEFERWVERERAGLRERAAVVARLLADRDASTGATREAMGWAKRALDLAPYDEATLRRLLDLSDKAGDRAGAIRVYNEFAERLDRDLSVQASAETRAVVEAMRTRVEATSDVRRSIASSIPIAPSATVASAGATPPGSTTSPEPSPRRRSKSIVIVGVLMAVIVLGTFAARRRASIATGRSTTADRTHRERVLIADFDRVPGDSDLASAVTEALRLDLSRSPAISVMPWSAVRGVLRRMRRDTVSHLDSILAREVAVREGVKAILAGDVRRTGGRFVLTARIVGADSGQIVEGWRETARDSSEILPALDRLSQSIRRRIGESVQSIRETPHPLRVATTSLEALQKHAMALRSFYSGDYARAAALYDEALKIDPTFADAWISLSIALLNMGVQPARQIEAIVKAYALRDRLPAWERYEIEGQYAYRVRGDLLSALASFRNQAELEPVDAFWAPIGSILNQLRRYEEAERAMTRAIEVSPTPYTYVYLAGAQSGQHKDSAAASTLEAGLARFPRFPGLELARIDNMIVRGEYSRADSAVHSFADRGSERFPLVAQASIDAMRGKPGEATQHLRTLRAAREQRGLFVEAIDVTIMLARLDLLVTGDTTRALRELDSELATHPLSTLDARERPYVRLANFYVEAGHPDRALSLLAEYESAVPRDYRATDMWSLIRTRADLRLARGEIAEGVAELHGAERGPPSLAVLAHLGRGYERLGQRDSAMAVYSRYLKAPYINRIEDDAWHLPRVLDRLAVLSEQAGDAQNALATYRRLADSWDDATPPVRARRAVIERRIADLQSLGTRP